MLLFIIVINTHLTFISPKLHVGTINVEYRLYGIEIPKQEYRVSQKMLFIFALAFYNLIEKLIYIHWEFLCKYKNFANREILGVKLSSSLSLVE